MLVRDDTIVGGVRAKILDFGIAKLLPELSSDDNASDERRSVRTRTGALIGTPAYMSPEQCRAAGPPDEKTDVYSLGTIFFEVLYGEPPFMSESAGELYALHMFAPPPDLRQRIKTLDPRLGALIYRMLAKKPDERPSMEDVLSELHGISTSGLSDGPIETRPSSVMAKRGLTESSDALAAIGSTSSIIRQQMNININTTTNNSTGEQVAQPGRKRGGRVLAALGGAGVVVLLGGFALFVSLRDHSLPPSPTVAESIKPAAAPAPLPTAAPPAPSSTSTSAPAAGASEKAAPAAPIDKSTAQTSPDSAAAPSPLRKEKSPRKGPHASKAEKYQIELWK